MKPKIVSSLDAAVADIPDGARIMFGGFGGAGFPNNLIQAMSRQGTKNITAISNNCGTREGELGIMFKHGQVKHVICSFPGPHANHFQERFAKGEVTCELVPQGILCERMRAAAAGLLGFYTSVGVGTEVAIGKEERVIEGQRCILEMPIHADYAFGGAEFQSDHGQGCEVHHCGSRGDCSGRLDSSGGRHHSRDFCAPHRASERNALCRMTAKREWL
jgi:3-oxoadipate CoA-transferase, alpha subunit